MFSHFLIGSLSYLFYQNTFFPFPSYVNFVSHAFPPQLFQFFFFNVQKVKTFSSVFCFCNFIYFFFWFLFRFSLNSIRIFMSRVSQVVQTPSTNATCKIKNKSKMSTNILSKMKQYKINKNEWNNDEYLENSVETTTDNGKQRRSTKNTNVDFTEHAKKTQIWQTQLDVRNEKSHFVLSKIQFRNLDSVLWFSILDVIWCDFEHFFFWFARERESNKNSKKRSMYNAF